MHGVKPFSSGSVKARAPLRTPRRSILRLPIGGEVCVEIERVENTAHGVPSQRCSGLGGGFGGPAVQLSGEMGNEIAGVRRPCRRSSAAALRTHVRQVHATVEQGHFHPEFWGEAGPAKERPDPAPGEPG